MGDKNLARITEPEVDKIFKLINIPREESVRGKFEVSERHLSKKDFECKDKDLSGDIIIHNIGWSMVNIKNDYDKLQISEGGISYTMEGKEPTIVTNKRVIDYLKSQGYGPFFIDTEDLK